MCEYCQRGKVINKMIKDIDNDEEEFAQIVFLPEPLLRVDLDGEDKDGYKVSDYFEINYCPMCGRKLEDK